MTRVVATPWRLARLSLTESAARLAFGRMHEDSSIELENLSGRIVCVASAGDTAIALAAADPDNRVTALDVNPAQIGYVKARLSGAPTRAGWVDRAISIGRHLAGWSLADAEAFAGLVDVDDQARAWRATFDTGQFRAALAVGVAPLGLLVAGAPVRRLPPRMDRVVRGRLASGFERVPNRTNPYASLLLLGIEPTSIARPAAGLDLRVGDVASYLESVRPHSIDGFSLSNITDATGPGYDERLRRAIVRAAAPRAIVVMRSFGEPHSVEEASWARRDRSHLWGRIRVGSAESLADTWRTR